MIAVEIFTPLPVNCESVCHPFQDEFYCDSLIAFVLSGENANELNLITGTMHMNVTGTLPFENMVVDYITETKIMFYIERPHVVFICTNMDDIKNLNLNTPGITVLRTYKTLELSETVMLTLLNLGKNKSVFNARVLHVNQNKLNHWTLGLIHQKYGYDGIEMLSNILCKKEDWNNMYTVFSYMLLIEKWNKK